MSAPNNNKHNTTTKSNLNTDKNVNSVEDALKPENYLTILKVENVSLISEIKKLNDMVSKLKMQLSNNNAEKQILLQNSSKKETDIKLLKEKLSIAKNELSSLKQKMDSSIKISELQAQNEELIKNKEIAKNHLVTLQNKITDLEYELKQQENPCNNSFNSPLIQDQNISLVLPSLPKYSSFSNIFSTDDENNQIDYLKNEISARENEKIKIENELQNIINERNKLLILLKEKNEEIYNKLNLQDKLSNELLEQIDKNKEYKSGYKEAKLKNQILEKDKKTLENVIISQEGKVLQMSASRNKINQMIEIKNIEICKNQKNIQNLEEVIKDFQKKFRNLKNNKDDIKAINSMRNQIYYLQNEYKNQIIRNQNMQKINLINSNNINNINNMNYFLRNNTKPNSKRKIPNNKYKLFENVNNKSKIICLSIKKQKKFHESNKISKKFKKNIFEDVTKNLGINQNEKIKNNVYNSNVTDNNDIEFINNKLILNTDNINNISSTINSAKKLPIAYTLSPIKNKLKICYNEKNEQKDKENIEEFKLFFNKLISNMEKD